MKDVELKLITELVKNSRLSDRELARRVRVSQPTITRTRNKLEKEGTIREYTIIPDFATLGYKLVSITFSKLEEPPSEKMFDEIRKRAKELEKKNPSPTIVIMKGIGLEADYVSVAFHKTYSEYSRYMGYIKQFPRTRTKDIKSFLIDLVDREHFRYLTLSVFADYLLRTKETQ